MPTVYISNKSAAVSHTSQRTTMSFNDSFIAMGSINGPAVATVFAIEGDFIGFIANTIVLGITIYRKKSWKQSSTVIFTSIILAHLIMIIMFLPLFVIAVGAEEWIFGSNDMQKRQMCLFLNFVEWTMKLLIQIMIAEVSFDQFLFLYKPNHHKKYMRWWVTLASPNHCALDGSNNTECTSIVCT